jgi:hypothetical protein
MIVVQETTDWAWPNHTYFLSDDRTSMLGYIQQGTDKFIRFSKPIGFETRGRKFETIRKVERRPEPAENTWHFEGSKGNIYTVTKEVNGLVCTCPGFQYRGHCKHITEVDNLAK